MRWLSVALCLSLASPAFAVGPVLTHCIFSWYQPPEPANDLAWYLVFIRRDQQDERIVQLPAVVTSGDITYTTENLCAGLPAGQRYARVVAVNTDGAASQPSQEVAFCLVPKGRHCPK